ncbi:hypothetical protein ABVK25_012169 [Lepraria finkii]|uniref:Uncharacterized protein n=1 Tax=Lepraria finkii TaxID=1340010 RepID=A0ABR4APM1_9LECA
MKVPKASPPSPSTTSSRPVALFEGFKLVAPYLIPPPALCNSPSPHPDALPTRTQTVNQGAASQVNHRILSYPVCISSEAYPRNAFHLLFGSVLDAHTEFSSYLPLVQKLATPLFRGLETGTVLVKETSPTQCQGSPRRSVEREVRRSKIARI